MNNLNPNPCARCGTPIPPGATDRLSPACLLSGAMNSPADATVTNAGLIPVLLVGWVLDGSAAFLTTLVWLALWLGGAVHAAMHPHRGWHDQLAGTRVVRQ